MLLASVAVFLVVQSRGLLIGESADPDVLAGVRDAIAASTEIDGIGRVLTMHMGPHQILLALEVHFRTDMPAARVPAAVARLEAAIRQRHPDVRHIFVEATSLGARSNGR